MFKYHIFMRYPAITIERPEKHGGNMEFSSFEA